MILLIEDSKAFEGVEGTCPFVFEGSKVEGSAHVAATGSFDFRLQTKALETTGDIWSFIMFVS